MRDIPSPAHDDHQPLTDDEKDEDDHDGPPTYDDDHHLTDNDDPLHYDDPDS